MGLLKKAESHLCGCGCGQPTKQLKFRCPKTGLPAGAYRQFVKGHHNRILSYHMKDGQIERHGYVYLYRPDHPYANKRHYIGRARLILESKLRRYLEEGECVHHINGIRNDDRAENLMVLTRGEHSSMHWAQKAKKIVEARWPKKEGLNEPV